MVLLTMRNYSNELKIEAINLRKEGRTHQEINDILKTSIPRSTFSGWFREITMNDKALAKLKHIRDSKLDVARDKALSVNREKREAFLTSLASINATFCKKIDDLPTAKIALSMLCLGEASKYKTGSVFSLGNTDKRIILLFIRLLNRCFKIDPSKFRFTVMCRADQDVKALEDYWEKVIGFPSEQFYKTRKDPRTVGKVTSKVGYMGVLKVDYIDTKVQLELESLADLIYNQVCAY